MKLDNRVFYDYIENNLFPGDIKGDEALLYDYLLLFLNVILNFYLL